MKTYNIGEKIFDVTNVIILGICGLIMLYPIWNVLTTSLVTMGEYYQRPFILFPRKFNFECYKYLFSSDEMLTSVGVTTFVTVVGCAFSMLLTTMLAYALSKESLPGGKLFMAMIVITMFFNGGLIPYYLLMRNLVLINTIWVLILPFGVSTWNFMVLKSFFTQFPVSLEEAAKIDGANDIFILFRLVIPLSMPALATITLFYGVAYWNTWWNALLFITDTRLHPLQLLLRKMIVQNASPGAMTVAYRELGGGVVTFDLGIKMAAVIIATVPILCVYPSLQKYFSKGVLIGAVKG